MGGGCAGGVVGEGDGGAGGVGGGVGEGHGWVRCGRGKREVVGEEAVGREAVGKEAVGKEAVGEEAVGKEAAGKEAVGKDAAGKKAAGKEAAGKKVCWWAGWDVARLDAGLGSGWWRTWVQGWEMGLGPKVVGRWVRQVRQEWRVRWAKGSYRGGKLRGSCADG